MCLAVFTKYQDDELLALSGLQHYAFCPRQWALIHLEQLWQENLRTAEGRIMHDKAHNPDIEDARNGVVTLRAVVLVSYELGLNGVADVIEMYRVDDAEQPGISIQGYKGRYQPCPVEYKRGRPKKDDRDAVQLCAQAICLEEMYGVYIEKGFLFYGQTRRRQEIVFDAKLRERVARLANQMHLSFDEGTTPPASRKVRCDLCSMLDVCLPKVTLKAKPVSAFIAQQIDAGNRELEEY